MQTIVNCVYDLRVDGSERCDLAYGHLLTSLTDVTCHAVSLLSAMTDINVIIYRQEKQKGLR